MNIRKFNHFTNDVIVIDGLWGCGKSLLFPIIFGMNDVEKAKINYNYEWLCQMVYLGKLDSNAAKGLLQIYADVDQYHNLIGREVNIRRTDETGFNNNPGSFRYIKRILSSTEGDKIADKINQNNLALHLMSHMILLVLDPLFEAFTNRLKLIEIVRHPVYSFNNWNIFFSRFNGPRVATLSFEYNDHKIPWFAHSWMDKYITLNNSDKTINSMLKMYKWSFEKIDEINSSDINLMVLSFEDIAFNTDKILQKLSSFLNRGYSKRIEKIKKKQLLPRKTLGAGRGNKLYGFVSKNHISDDELYSDLYKNIQSQVSKKYMAEFDLLIHEYNQRFPSKIALYNDN